MQDKRSVSALLLMASLVLVGAGCGQKAAINTSTTAAVGTENRAPAPSRAPAAPPSDAASDTCGNPYYPFKAGLAITYGATTSQSGAAAIPDYTMRVISVTGTTAALRVEMGGGISADMTADCAGGSVAMKGAFDLGTATQGAKMKTTVVSQTGTYLPANVAVGSTWSNAQTVKMEMTEGAGAGMGPITVNTSTTNSAVARESVTVPAGTYDAVKVEVTRTTSSELSGMPAGIKLPPGTKIPTPAATTTTSSEWWVKGIGMVKSVTVNQGVTTTVVAKSVTGL